MDSWADAAEDEKVDFSAPAPPPKTNAWGKAAEAPKPVGLVFEDFDGPVPSSESREDRGPPRGDSDRGSGSDRGFADRGGDRYGDRGGGREYGERRDRGERRGGGDRWAGGDDDAMSGWRDSGFSGQSGRERGGYDDRRPSRREPPPFEWEPPSEETLAKIPKTKPFTAFVTVAPQVNMDVEEDEVPHHSAVLPTPRPSATLTRRRHGPSPPF